MWPFRRPAAEPEPEPAPEIPPLDPMVLCPSCGLMGHHSLEEVPAVPPRPLRTIEQPDGEVVEIFTWQSAAGIPAHYRRRCMFCEHAWTLPKAA